MLNSSTNLLLIASVVAILGGWGGTVFLYLKNGSLSQRQPIGHRTGSELNGKPTELVLEEGKKLFPWLADYELNSTKIKGNEVILVTSGFRASREEAFEEARRFQREQIGHRLQQQHPSLSEVEVTQYFPTHEGTLEKTITVGAFDAPMYRAYLLTSLTEQALSLARRNQINQSKSRSAELLLISLGLVIISLAGVWIAFRFDLASTGQCRWVGNLIGSGLVLSVGGGCILTLLKASGW